MAECKQYHPQEMPHSNTWEWVPSATKEIVISGIKMEMGTALEQAYRSGFEACKRAAIINLHRMIEMPEDMRVKAVAAINATEAVRRV